MKRRIFLGILLPFILASFLVPEVKGQTAWTTGLNGKVTQENGWKIIDFQGVLKGTDTLVTNPFNLFFCDLNFTLSRLFTQTNDSVKITIKRQDSYIPGQWTVAKTIATSDSIKTAGYYADTLAVPANSRFLFIGTTGNGNNVQLKAKIRARNR